MHELGITESIVEIAERTAKQQQASKVLSVTVEVGSLSGVVPEALEFCFEACSKGTLLEGAQLLIEKVAARARCRDCAREFPLDDLLACCPVCRSAASELLSGEELRIKEMEID
ncbi:hydrogenase maturation nickel metallochaperone HypA [Malonomonas rubra]|uniref:hydrogenase maturation nickel metallochaperone HypA n=1 Tax=Malonomonas rubra TaxID=57040 RepID=UPI0026EF795D|nr:hydrogenase maturation nickel metallochaperone HypA [Malonomonas rubra]